MDGTTAAPNAKPPLDLLIAAPRGFCAVMKGSCEVASAVAGAASVKVQPTLAQPSLKPCSSESK